MASRLQLLIADTFIWLASCTFGLMMLRMPHRRLQPALGPGVLMMSECDDGPISNIDGQEWLRTQWRCAGISLGWLKAWIKRTRPACVMLCGSCLFHHPPCQLPVAYRLAMLLGSRHSFSSRLSGSSIFCGEHQVFHMYVCLCRCSNWVGFVFNCICMFL